MDTHDRQGSSRGDKRSSRAGRFWRETLKPMLVVIVLLSSFRSAIADWNDVPTSSMRPTIEVGDRVTVNRVAYDLRLPFTTISLWHRADPQRGDIIVFYSPVDGKRLVKRVIGVPGDRIEMVGWQLLVNDEPATYDPSRRAGASAEPAVVLREQVGDGPEHAVRLIDHRRIQRGFGPVVVPAESYFVMGDNRDESYDSRAWGYVPRSSVLGQAFGVAFSLDRDHGWRPRAERFAQPLT